MKIRLPRENLADAMGTLQTIATAKNTLPILGNVLIDVGEDGIVIAATNLEVAVRLRVEGTVEETGNVTVPAAKLAELARELPDEEVRLETSENAQVQIECGRVFYRMFGMPAKDFPKMQDLGEEFFTFDAGVLTRMIQQTKFAASTEETRYFLNGVYLHLSPKWIRMVATDSRRLALVHLAQEGLIESEKGVIIPIKGAEEAVRTFEGGGEIKVAIRDNQIVLANDRATLNSRLVDGEYPAYSQIIPKDNPIQLRVNREAFLTAVRRVSLFSDTETLAVRLEIKETSVLLSASTTDYGEAREEIEGTCTEPIQIGFSAKFLMDALAVLDDEEVRLDFKEPLSAAVLRPVESRDVLCLIMPMRTDT